MNKEQIREKVDVCFTEFMDFAPKGYIEFMEEALEFTKNKLVTMVETVVKEENQPVEEQKNPVGRPRKVYSNN